jgi:hypothetical protein
MTEQVSPLRQRMIDDMKIRNMSPNSQRAYIRAVKNFGKHFRKSPDKLTFEDVRTYQLHLVSRGLQAATIIPIMCAILLRDDTRANRCRCAYSTCPQGGHVAGGSDARPGGAVPQGGACQTRSVLSPCAPCNGPAGRRSASPASTPRLQLCLP